jgi:RHS repeat-associated protein
MTDYVMGTWTYTYDDFNRLSSGTAASGVDDGLTLGWTYDRYGNRWTQTATGTGNASAVQPNLAFYGNNNQVSGWDYDAAGNLTNDNRNTYAYDAEGRIVSLNSAPTYAYDAEGHRVAKLGSGGTVATSYLLDLSGNQVTELNATGGWKHSNVWAAGGRLLATYEGPAGTDTVGYHFHLTDWLGTQRMQTTAAGNQEEECYSYPFGDGLTCTGTDATEHHFTSKERDTESGLDYFGARYLSSDLGRFMTPDWAAKPTDVPYATFGDPQTLNLYAYVGNDPNTKVDLDGHVDWGEVWQGVCHFVAALTVKSSLGIGVEGGYTAKGGAYQGGSIKAGAAIKDEFSISKKGPSIQLKAEAGIEAGAFGAKVKAMPSETASLVKDGAIQDNVHFEKDPKPTEASMGDASVNGDREVALGETATIPTDIPVVVEVGISESASDLASSFGEIYQGLTSSSSNNTSTSSITPPPTSTANASSPPEQN